MNTTTLEIKEMEPFRATKKTINTRALQSPPEGFMTGDEFERRVKERVTKFYKEINCKNI